MSDSEITLIINQLNNIEKKLDKFPCIEHGERIIALITKNEVREKSIVRRLTIYSILIAIGTFFVGLLSKIGRGLIEK